MELVIASSNSHKVKEIKEILGSKFEKIYSISDLGIESNPEETESSFLGNALIKANAVLPFACGRAVLADDSGLEVDALNGAPGVRSARYAGEHATSDENNQLLLKALDGENNRTAAFKTVMVLLFPNGKIISGEGEVRGRIIDSYRGTSGFGYDPLFYSPELGKTFGEATSIEKNSVSHRFRALMDLLGKL